MSQMIDPEVVLETVFRQLLRAGKNSGVANENVQRQISLTEFFSEFSNGFQRF